MKRSMVVQYSQKRVMHPKLDVERVELSNGLVLLLSENHSIPPVLINAIVQAGSRFEDDNKAGLASLVGSLLDAGTETRTSQQIAETIEAVGGQLGTYGNYQSSGVMVRALSQDTVLGLDVTSDLIMNPNFPEAKVREHVDRRIAQIKSRLDVPRTRASDVFNEIVFEGSPQHRPSIGYEDTVKKLNRADVYQFYQRFYVPQITKVAIAGDFDKNLIKGLVEATFGKWNAPAEFDIPEVRRPVRQTSPIFESVNAPKEQVNVIMGHLGIERSNPDYYALLVMDTILGSSPGFTSRIPRVLRDEQGLAYTTFSNITSSAGLDPGRFLAYIGTAPENLDRAVSGLRGEISRIVVEGITPEELETAQLYL